MNVLVRRLAPALCAMGLLLGMGSAQAQRDPRPVLNGMILQFQTGTPNPYWYSPQLWQLFAIQTQNSGVYPLLQQLGPVQNIVINASQQFPVGWLYSMTAFHSNGRSDWRIGINQFTDRIEYADSAIGQNQPFLLPSPNIPDPVLPDRVPPDRIPPNPNPIPAPNPVPNPVPPDPAPVPDAKTSEACKQFPNLC